MLKKRELHAHQKETVEFLRARNRVFIGSTAGTGKTLCIITDVVNRLNANLQSKTLILAPKSLLYTVWEREFKEWAPHVAVSTALAPEARRIAAFKKPAQVYITNIDALVWLKQQPDSFWEGFETVIIDESTSIKNDSQRTKAAMVIRKHFKYRRCMSGTPIAGLLTDLFYQYLFLDDGASFGTSYTKFRNQVLIAKQNGPHPKMVKWSNKPGREKILAHIVKPITIRHVLQEVVDMPPVITYHHKYKPNAKVMKAYTDMKRDASLQLKNGQINAINAAALTTKLLQIASGSVIDTATQTTHLIDTQRYDIILDLCDPIEHAVVFFNWKSQLKYFLMQSAKLKYNVTYIDGSVKNRAERISKYQSGKYKIIFLQIKSSSHGITLTKASHTFWSCPSYLADYVSQGNNRVFRLGQTKRTVVCYVEAENTLDAKVYNNLNTKLTSMELLESEL